MPRQLTRTGAALLPLVLLLAACGGGATQAPETFTPPSTAPTDAPTEQPSEAAGGGATVEADRRRLASGPSSSTGRAG